MSSVIFRGSTPTLTFRPTNGMSVADLGTATVAIAQDNVYLEKTGADVAVDTSGNTASVKLAEEETLRLVPGAVTKAQIVWKNGDDVYRFPEHELSVASTLVETANGGA